MKKLSLCLTMLALLACALGTPASAQKMSDKDALVQRYYWYEELLASANSEDLIYMLTSDFTNVPSSRQDMNRQQSEALVRLNSDAVHRVYGVNVVINKLDIRGDYAVALITEYFNSDDKDLRGNIHRIITNSVMRQVWIRTEDGWKLRRNRILRAQVNIDGEITLYNATKTLSPN